jgi:thiol-disulfide isomerase/thioredoxin
MTENSSFLFQYLKKENIYIDQDEFTFQIQSHPDSPSLLAISDTFSFFKIYNLATRIDIEDMIHMPDHFIALLKDGESASFLSFIERIGNTFRYTHGGKEQVVANETFKDLFQNVVLVIEKEDGDVPSIQKNKSYFSLILLGIGYLATIFITGFSLLSSLFLILVLIGIYFSIEAISHEFGIKTKFSEAVCTLTTKIDCDAVINGKKSKFLEFINFSDSSIIFFSTQLLALFLLTLSNQMVSFYNMTTILLLISLPVTLASLYQQFFIVKKRCPICLAIIVVLYLELISLMIFHNFSLTISMVSIVYYLFSIASCYCLFTFVKKNLKANVELKSEITANNRFKRNYSLFKMALLSSETVDYKRIATGGIILGNPDAKLKILVVSSPFCGHCKAVHENILMLLERYNNVVSIEIRFNFNQEFSNENIKIVHQRLLGIYLEKGQETFINALENWFEDKNIEQLKPLEDNLIVDLKINEILNEQFLWNQENAITFTPAVLINGYHFPVQYDRNDLIYFVNELVEDDVF